uniref:Uncharacterized protein n=1 Tax=Clastoptera arizonana TaxID=38151 RepID=A0A1B6CM55_9HEMI
MNVGRVFKRLLLITQSYECLKCINSQSSLKNVMKYSRWTHRKPAKVLLSENDIDPLTKENDKQIVKRAARNIKSDFLLFKKPLYQTKYGINDEEMSSDDENKIEENEISGTSYTTLFNSDTTLSQLMLKVKSRKTREKYGIMMLEGKRLNQDAILAGLLPKDLFFSRVEDVKSLSMPSGVINLYKITYKAMKLWSSLETPPGVIGFYKIPQNNEIKEDINSIPLTIICDNIRDPGNVGAILRTAAGVGCKNVLFVTGCADVWDSKVLRSASGGHFRIPLKQDLGWNDVNQHLSENISVYLADNRITIPDHDDLTNSLSLLPYYNVDFSASSSLAIVIGGETEGLSKQAVLLSKHHNGARINIPLANELDSLNSGAALSVILFEIKRQLLLVKNQRISAERKCA